MGGAETRLRFLRGTISCGVTLHSPTSSPFLVTAHAYTEANRGQETGSTIRFALLFCLRSADWSGQNRKLCVTLPTNWTQTGERSSSRRFRKFVAGGVGIF